MCQKNTKFSEVILCCLSSSDATISIEMDNFNWNLSPYKCNCIRTTYTMSLDRSKRWKAFIQFSHQNNVCHFIIYLYYSKSIKGCHCLCLLIHFIQTVQADVDITELWQSAMPWLVCSLFLCTYFHDKHTVFVIWKICIWTFRD